MAEYLLSSPPSRTHKSKLTRREPVRRGDQYLYKHSLCAAAINIYTDGSYMPSVYSPP